MPLSPGARLGAYEIIAALGAGGMGEVYKARDTRLDRVVAIKVVTAALAGDSDLRTRFEQEARAIAALNHPHICTIHDVGRDGGVDFLVMEYLEGETLADRVKSGPRLSTADALAIAIQIGDALEAAHRVGIVHRDLKPGNVMLVRNAGQRVPTAKLLDFGLAVAASSKAPAREASLLATVAPSMMATRASNVTPAGFSGTVQYMAPEQIDAVAIDHRADIFAFGCVLYEMLAGRKAFEGATAIAVIAAVMGTEPPPIPALQSAPPVLDHLLRRCLEKDRERRWQSMADVTGELRWIASQPLTVAPAGVAPRRWSARETIAAAAIAIVAIPLALLAGIRWLRPPGTPAASPLQFEVSSPPSDDAALALSPDGRQIVFVANRDRRPRLWLRSLDRAETRELPGTEGASLPFWSPDGRTIGFFAENKLKRIDLAGHTTIVIADAPTPRGGAWGPGGVILFVSGVNSPIMRVSSDGGAAEAVTTLTAETGPSHRMPQFLPDGRFLFFSSLGGPETEGVYLGSLDGTPPVRLLAGDSPAIFAPPDRLLTVRQGALVAYAFNLRSGRIEGEPDVVAQGFISGGAAGAYAASANGTLAYRAGTTQRRQLAWVSRDGMPLQSVGEPRADYPGSPELSPDERQVAIFEQPTGDNDVWVIDLVRNLPRRITDGPPADAHPVWDPDGRHLAFGTQRFPGGGRQAVDGNSPAEPLFASRQTGTPLSWTRDRRFVLLRTTAPQGSGDLVAVSIDGTQTVPVARSVYEETEGQFSPDGSWVALVSNDTGSPEVYVQSFPAGTARTQLSIGGGTQVRWSADGREVFYVAPDGRMMVVGLDVRDGAPAPAPPLALFQTHLATGTNVIGNKAQYAVSRDGRFLLNTAVESPSAPIVVSTGWTHLLAR